MVFNPIQEVTHSRTRILRIGTLLSTTMGTMITILILGQKLLAALLWALAVSNVLDFFSPFR